MLWHISRHLHSVKSHIGNWNWKNSNNTKRLTSAGAFRIHVVQAWNQSERRHGDDIPPTSAGFVKIYDQDFIIFQPRVHRKLCLSMIWVQLSLFLHSSFSTGINNYQPATLNSILLKMEHDWIFQMYVETHSSVRGSVPLTEGRLLLSVPAHAWKYHLL